MAVTITRTGRVESFVAGRSLILKIDGKEVLLQGDGNDDFIYALQNEMERKGSLTGWKVVLTLEK